MQWEQWKNERMNESSMMEFFELGLHENENFVQFMFIVFEKRPSGDFLRLIDALGW